MNMLIRFFMLMTLIKREQDAKATSKATSIANHLAKPQSNNQQPSNHQPQSNKQQPNHQQPATTTNSVINSFSRDYRILPHDMGFRDHLPNYRYLSFIELNITGWLTTVLHGIHGPKLKSSQKFDWIIAMQEMVYLKQVKMLSKMTVTSKIEGWDGKYIYFQHHFMVKDKTMAIGLTKFILANKKGNHPPAIIGLEGNHLTEVISTWNANQSAIKAQNAK